MLALRRAELLIISKKLVFARKSSFQGVKQDWLAAQISLKLLFRCEGKERCTLDSNNQYGDPCFGIYKYLEVKYLCA